MHAVFTYLMAGLLFIHTVAGCCWQYAQCMEQRLAASVCGKVVGCCKHHHQKSQDEDSKRPCKCKIECSGTCTYLAPQKVQVNAPDAVVTIDFAAALPVSINAPTTACEWNSASCPDDAKAPLRLHLLHQILLI